MSTTPTPVTIRRAVTMRRLAAADAPARALAARRRETAKNGYRGPLTRAELGRYGLAEVASRTSRRP
jgi:hypothetical protein